MSNGWRDYLQTRLLELRPASLCALDAHAQRLALDTLPATPVSGPDQTAAAPCALALGVDTLDGLDARQAQHLISQVRLYRASRMLLAVKRNCPLDEAGFRALGFTLAFVDESDGVRIHEYDLDTYKTVPDWLNARFWAHPERWEP